MDREQDITENELQAPFKLLTTATRYRCLRCGHIAEISAVTAHSFIKVMGMLGAFPEVAMATEEDFKDYYFEISYCKLCKNRQQDHELSIRLKPLKQELK